MKVVFDPVKSEKNVRERGLPFEFASSFEWENAVAWKTAAATTEKKGFAPSAILKIASIM